MRNFKKTIALVLCFIMAVCSFAYAEEVQLISNKVNDYEGHWAEATIQKWMDEGRVSGYPDGSYKPDNNVTRAEFVKLVNGIIDFNKKATITYKDVPASEWYFDYVGVAQEIGYISGYSPDKFGPNDYITREQAASILARIQYLENNALAAEKFNDSKSISKWAVESVGAAANASFIKGYDGNFKPQNNLTRAEALTMVDNVLVNGKNVVVYKDGTKLKDTVVEGDLIIAKTVGDGDVYLENVEVKGNLYVYGGGKNSLYFNNLKVSKIIVEKDKVRLVLGEGTNVQEIDVTTEAVLENTDGTVAKIILSGDNAVTLTGEFKEVNVVGNSDIVLKDAKITTLIVEKPIVIEGSGTIATLNANANGIKFEADIKITKTVTGNGVTEAPAKVETPAAGGGGGGGGSSGPVDPENPALNKNFKFILKSSVSRVDSKTEIVPIREAEYHSFKEYKGSTKLSTVIGEEINYVIGRLEANDKLFIDKAKPFLEKLNSKMEDVQLVELNDSKNPDDRTKFYNNGVINWTAINQYLAGTSIVLPNELKAKNGDFTIDDVISVLRLYNSTTIESDLVIIKNNLPKGKTLNIIPETWPKEGEIIPLDIDSYIERLGDVIDGIFSNDQIYQLGEHSFSFTEELNNTVYKFKLVFIAEELK